MAEVNVAIRIDPMRMAMRPSLEMASELGVRSVELNAPAGSTLLNCRTPGSVSCGKCSQTST